VPGGGFSKSDNEVLLLEKYSKKKRIKTSESKLLYPVIHEFHNFGNCKDNKRKIYGHDS
jgi:hypothetical protein